MKTEVLDIEGMMCDACAGHVTRALRGLAGVRSAEVSLGEKRAVVVFEPAEVQVMQMMEAVAEEGYSASPRD